MKRFSEQFHTKAQSVKLQAVERDALRERIQAYVEYHPLAVTASTRKRKVMAVPNPLSFTDTLISIPTRFVYSFSAAIAVLLLVVVPALAEKAVPGDSLYAVKVSFNEEIRSTLTFDQKAKVEWETERLNRRIAEARLLASEGRLNGEVGAQVAEAVRQHTEVVKKEIAELRTSDADAATLASIELNTTLKTQSNSLQQDGNVDVAIAATQDTSTQLVVDALNESLTQDGASSTIPSYDKIMARLEQNTTRSYELLKATQLTDTDPLKSDINRRLDDVNRSIEQANNTRGQDEASASRLLIDALERTQKLIVYMSDINVNRSIALETVVPKILTDDEKKTELAALNVDINHRVEVLETLHPKLNKNVSEKVDYSIKAAKQKQDEANADVSKVTQNYGKDTIAMLDDTLKIIAASGVNVNNPGPDTTAAAKTAATTTPATASTTVGGD